MINPGFQVHSLVDGRVQIGSGSNALWISGLSAEEHRFVRSLSGEQAQAQVPGAVSEPDLLPGGPRRAEILNLLRTVLVKDSAPALHGLAGSLLSADVAQWSAAYGMDARAPMVRRGEATVCIRGLDRSGQLLAWILAAAGIGGLILEDPAPLRIGDLGSTPMRIGDVGRPRATAVRRALLRVHPRLRVADTAVRGPGLQPDIVEVVFGSGPPTVLPSEPVCLGLLAVVLLESGARIGPLLIPGLGLCPECFTARVGAGLLREDTVSGAPAPVIHPELSLAATIAGIAATQCLMLIDQVNIPSCTDTVVEIDLASGAVVHVPVSARTGCGCLEALGKAA